MAHQYISIGGEGAYGMAVVAAMDGIVSKVVSADERLGTYIEITHTDGLSTIYATLGSTAVSVSQPVNAGMVIGKVGMSGNATGPSLHFEVRCNGSPVNPHLYLEES